MDGRDRIHPVVADGQRDASGATGRDTPHPPASDAAGASRLERILKASNDGYWEWSVTSDFAWVSPRWIDIVGLPAEDGMLAVDAARSAIHPDDWPEVRAKAGRVMEDDAHGDSCHVEHRFVRPDGKEVWVDARATVTARASDGRATQVSGVITDITGRKHAEDTLRRFELIAENTRDIVLFLRRDDGRILEANAAASVAYGYSRDELLGMTVHDLRAPDTLGRVGDEMAKADESTILFETTHRRKDGATFPAEVSSRGATIGGLRTLISIIRDITERAHAREATASAALFPIENPSPVIRIRGDGVLDFANAASQSVLDQWGVELGAAVPAHVRELVESSLAKSKRVELEMSCDGREFSLAFAPITDAGYVNVYGYDVTERKQAERTLSRAKARQELLARVVSQLLETENPQSVVEDLAREVMGELGCDVFFNYLVDADTQRLHLNACAGIPPDERKKLEWLELGSAICGCVAQDQAGIVEEDIALNPQPRTQLVGSFGVQSYACHPLTAGGRLIGTLSFGSRTKPRFLEEDLDVMRSVTNHIAIAMDRLRARNLLSESEQRYRTIARSIPQGGVWVVDHDLRYRLVEGVLPEVLDTAAPRLEGRTVREALPESLWDVVEARFRKALAGESASYETAVGGRTLWSQYVPLRDEEGRITRAMALTLDITERKRLEERLRDSQKMESVALLAGGIAHDFNNLLVGILGNLSLGLEICDGREKLAGILEEAIKAGEQAAHLTREMLAYSGRGKFVVEPVNLSALVTGAASLVRSSIPNEVALGFDLDPSVAAIQADATQVQQIVMNLVINAAEAIGKRRGQITVRTRPEAIGSDSIRNEWSGFELTPGAYVSLEVEDTGSGMDSATKSRIFDPFFTTKFTGRGLGLAAVLGIVRGHKGAIRVASEPGRGSVFTIVFPAAGRIEPSTPTDERRAPQFAGGGTVLVVDDEPLVLRMALSTLNSRGFRVLSAESGAAALEILRGDSSIDLLVLDLSMPGMSGQQTLPGVRKLRPGLPVLISSGYSESECRELFRNDRISGFLQKPYTAARLAEAVDLGMSAKLAKRD